MENNRNIERVKTTGEVFTPDRIVNDMLNNFPVATFMDNEEFLDPMCGNGQFIIAVLNKKVTSMNDSGDDCKLLALKKTYGADLMASNIADLIARIVFWKTWDIEIFNSTGQPKDGLDSIHYNEHDDAYWLKDHIEAGGVFERTYKYEDHIVKIKSRGDKWWRMEYNIVGSKNKDKYTGGGFCKNFIVADALKYNFEFNDRAPVLETTEEEKIRKTEEKLIKDGVADQSTLEF